MFCGAASVSAKSCCLTSCCLTFCCLMSFCRASCSVRAGPPASSAVRRRSRHAPSPFRRCSGRAGRARADARSHVRLYQRRCGSIRSAAIRCARRARARSRGSPALRRGAASRARSARLSAPAGSATGRSPVRPGNRSCRYAPAHGSSDRRRRRP